jgi:hypothetical protein
VRTRVRVVLGVALALVAVGLVAVLSQRGERMAGTSFVPNRTFAVELPPHGRACQPGTHLADDSAAAVVLVGSFGRPVPALTLTFTEPGGRLVARGSVAGGGPEGERTVPFERVVEGGREGVIACVRNHGDVRVALGGDTAAPPTAARVGGAVTQGAVGFRYLRVGDESWSAIAPVVAQRFGLGKSALFGTWTLPVLALALIALWFATLRLLGRETSS